MKPKSIVNAGVIGMGFMGRTHVAAYEFARHSGYPCKLLAICDQDVARLVHTAPAQGNLKQSCGENLFDPENVRTFTDIDAILDDPEIQLVSICTHTDSHADLAIRALEKGKHVLVEKPVAVRWQDVARVRDAARKASALCMPAFCMRFWPGWSWLKQVIVEGTYGAVRSAVFERLASPPGWAPNFYRDSARSGGALVDLHIHDADFVRWCFGPPDAVSSSGSLDHVTTLYRYARGPKHVVAEGGWDHTPGFPFKMRFVVAFEAATAEFDSGREPPLVLARDGELNPVPLESITGWDLEIRHIVHVIAEGGRGIAPTIDDALGVAKLLSAEAESLRTAGPVKPDWD